jgi:YesN/AraC family two-component response regulator
MINCFIIDDEPLARKGLREYISDVEFLHLAGEYDNALKATEMISRGEVQLLFLDIQMPKITGLEFMKTLQKPCSCYFHYCFSAICIRWDLI